MNNAVLSPCGLYRYRLDRHVQDEGKVFAYFGINPSTADADLDDATVRKWKGFTLRNGGRKFIVGNVFSFRATNVNDLDAANRMHIKVQGPEHDLYLAQIIAEADVLVACWGNSLKVDRNLRPLVKNLLSTLLASGKMVYHFGLTQSADPKHPLMLSYDTPLLPWGIWQ